MSKRQFTAFEKSFIQERAKYCCEYCKFPSAYSHDSFHIEHIIPLRLGGNNELETLLTLVMPVTPINGVISSG